MAKRMMERSQSVANEGASGPQLSECAAHGHHMTDDEDPTKVRSPSEVQMQNQDAELKEYISQMLLLISTGNEKADMTNIELVASNIQDKALQMHKEFKITLGNNLKELKNEIKKTKDESFKQILLDKQLHLVELLAKADEKPSKEHTVQYLKKLRLEYLAEVAKGKKPHEVLNYMSNRVFKGGMTTMQTASMTLSSSSIAAATAAAKATGASTGAVLSAGGSAAVPGPMGLIVSGVIFSAQTGLDYRRYMNGQITKSEFQKRTKRGVFATAGSMMGTTGGMVGGFLVGQALIPFPIIGGIIGTVVGGFAGGMTG